MLRIPLTNGRGLCTLASIGSGVATVSVYLYDAETDSLKAEYFETTSQADEFVIKLAAKLLDEGMEVVA